VCAHARVCVCVCVRMCVYVFVFVCVSVHLCVWGWVFVGSVRVCVGVWCFFSTILSALCKLPLWECGGSLFLLQEHHVLSSFLRRLSAPFPSAGPHAPSLPHIHPIPAADHYSVPYPQWVAPPPHMGSW